MAFPSPPPPLTLTLHPHPFPHAWKGELPMLSLTPFTVPVSASRFREGYLNSPNLMANQTQLTNYAPLDRGIQGYDKSQPGPGQMIGALNEEVLKIAQDKFLTFQSREGAEVVWPKQEMRSPRKVMRIADRLYGHIYSALPHSQAVPVHPPSVSPY